PDGSILVSGYPMTIAGGSVGPMIRLNDQGVLDPEWNISTPLYSHYVRDIELLPDGRSLVSGHHQGAQYLRILEPNGVIDTTIYSSTEVGITDLVLVNDKIAGIGYMESYAGIPWRNIFMAQADGTPDLTFNKAGGA